MIFTKHINFFFHIATNITITIAKKTQPKQATILN